MSRVLTSNELITSIERRTAIPEAQETFTSDDLLDMLNEEMGMYLVPQVMKVHEEYYVYSVDTPLVQDQSRYVIPYRAVGNKLRDVAYKNNSNTIYEMSRVSRELIPEFAINTTLNYYNYYYLERNEIVLLGEVTANADYLLISYFLRPNKLVANSRGGVITNIDTTTGIITMNNFPSHFSSLPQFDFICAKAPNIIISFDVTALSTDSTLKTVTFDVDNIPDKLLAGDYLMQREESIVPQLPMELHALLAQRVGIKCLEAQGDTEALALARTDLERMEESCYTLIDNRVDGSPQKINNINSLLRLGTNRYRRYR